MALSQNDLQQIQSLIAASQNKPQYGVSAVQHHTHNDIDSPKLNYTNLTNTPNFIVYAGAFGYSSGNFNPNGWTVSGSGGSATITHNLNTLNYAVSILPTPGASNTWTTQGEHKTTTSYQVVFQVGGSSVSTPPFDFILVEII
jgi:hypothetical protein